MGLDTSIQRTQDKISDKRDAITDWRARLAATDDARSAASLRAHITRAERDIAALEARIEAMRAAMGRRPR